MDLGMDTGMDSAMDTPPPAAAVDVQEPTRPAAPIPMPSRGSLRPLGEQIGQQLGMCARRAQAGARRLKELLQAARSEEGRRRNVIPLMVLAASATLVMGAAWGIWRGGRGRSR